MTRKQALLSAIQILSNDSERDNSQIIGVLRNIVGDLPLNRWSEDTIYDTVKQFIEDNGRHPVSKDWRSKALPPHPSVKLRTGLTVAEYMQKYFPKSRTQHRETINETVEQFKDEFTRIQPTSCGAYNAKRGEGVPDWRTVAKMLNASRWNELLEATGLSVGKEEVPYTPSIRLINGISDMLAVIKELEAESKTL